MKKTKFTLFMIPLLLTACSSSLRSNEPKVNNKEEEKVPVIEVQKEEPQEEFLETIIEETPEVVEQPAVVDEPVINEEPLIEDTIEVVETPEVVETEEIVETTEIEEEPTIVEETSSYEDRPIYNEEGEFISPRYRPTGTTDTTTLDLDIRSTEATITDSGRVNQKMDIVYLDYNYAGLEDLGYYWLDVKVTLTAREVNDGYQYLFLYNTSKCQSVGESLLENFIPSVGDGIKQGMLFKEQFEIGPGYKKTSWEQRDFRFYVYVGNMVDNLYLRYGANGILADTWINKDVKVTVTPKMTKN